MSVSLSVAVILGALSVTWWGARGFLEASCSTSLWMGPAANRGEQIGRGASWGQSEGLSVGCGVGADSSPLPAMPGAVVLLSMGQ